MELATDENALFAFDPINRTVPTTSTRITASITAYSAMSCPCSSIQSLQAHFNIIPPGKIPTSRERKDCFEQSHNAFGGSALSIRDSDDFPQKSANGKDENVRSRTWRQSPNEPVEGS